MMKTFFLSLFFMGLATALPAAIPTAKASDAMVIIVNSANQQSLTEQDIKNIYSDIITNWKSGQRINLYNLPGDDNARDKFSRAIFGETTREILQQEHNRKITNSIKNPSRTKRASLLSTIVSRDVNAIAYLPKAMLKSDKDIRIVLEID
jgi:ABC-type phosphate transport system substrate-binding protein